MAETILQDTDQIAPGRKLTVFFKPWWVSAGEVKAEIVRVFGGTIFPVEAVTLDLWGTVAFSGTVRSSYGATTAPGRNVTAAEFRAFVNYRLNLISGAAGDVEADRIVAGDQTASNAAPGAVWLYLIVGLVAVVATAYLISSVAKLGAVVKP